MDDPVSGVVIYDSELLHSAKGQEGYNYGELNVSVHGEPNGEAE